MLYNNWLALLIHGTITTVCGWAVILLVYTDRNLDPDLVAKVLLLLCCAAYLGAGTLLDVQKTPLLGFLSVSLLFIMLSVFMWLNQFYWADHTMMKYLNYPTFAVYEIIPSAAFCGDAPYVPMTNMLLSVIVPPAFLWSGLELKTLVRDMQNGLYDQDDEELP